MQRVHGIAVQAPRTRAWRSASNDGGLRIRLRRNVQHSLVFKLKTGENVARRQVDAHGDGTVQTRSCEVRPWRAQCQNAAPNEPARLPRSALRVSTFRHVVEKQRACARRAGCPTSLRACTACSMVVVAWAYAVTGRAAPQQRRRHEPSRVRPRTMERTASCGLICTRLSDSAPALLALPRSRKGAPPYGRSATPPSRDGVQWATKPHFFSREACMHPRGRAAAAVDA